jgi:hypothetical protein
VSTYTREDIERRAAEIVVEWHLPTESQKRALAELLAYGPRVKARIEYVEPTEEQKRDIESLLAGE